MRLMPGVFESARPALRVVVRDVARVVRPRPAALELPLVALPRVPVGLDPFRAMPRSWSGVDNADRRRPPRRSLGWLD
jgi:hypothetical protein